MDGGDPQETRLVKEFLGFVDGQTTNPSLIAKNPHIRELIASGHKLSNREEMDEYKKIVQQLAVGWLLHEGGPTLFGRFLAAGVVDELFLTMSPQIAGRAADTIRPALVQRMEFMPESAPWFRLLSVKQRSEHLYLRYQRTGAHTSA